LQWYADRRGKRYNNRNFKQCVLGCNPAPKQPHRNYQQNIRSARSKKNFEQKMPRGVPEEKTVPIVKVKSGCLHGVYTNRTSSARVAGRTLRAYLFKGRHFDGLQA
jgi:hypothetical protein